MTAITISTLCKYHSCVSVQFCLLYVMAVLDSHVYFLDHIYYLRVRKYSQWSIKVLLYYLQKEQHRPSNGRSAMYLPGTSSNLKITNDMIGAFRLSRRPITIHRS